MKRLDHIRTEYRAHADMARAILTWPRVAARVELQAAESRAMRRRAHVRALAYRREQRRIVGEIIGTSLSVFAAVFMLVALLALVNFGMRENAKREGMRQHVESLQKYGRG